MLNLYLSENEYDGMTPGEREVYEDLIEHRKEKKKKDSNYDPDEKQDRLDDHLDGDTIRKAVVYDIFSVIKAIYLN